MFLFQLYNQAKDLCMQMYGEYHILTSRLYINIGIVYEDNNQYKKAYEYFKKWARVSEEILGPDHPKTQRAKGVLKETRYRRIAIELGEIQADNQEVLEDQEGDDEIVGESFDGLDVLASLDLEHYCEQEIGVNSDGEVQLNIRRSSSSQMLEVSSEGLSATQLQDRNNNDEDPQSLMNGYDDRNTENSDSDDEDESDNENYDDNVEAYDEQYILHGDSGPVIEDFNVSIDDDDDDDEIVQLTSREPDESDCRDWYCVGDNRYTDERDGHENSDEDLDVDESVPEILDSNRTADDRT